MPLIHKGFIHMLCFFHIIITVLVEALGKFLFDSPSMGIKCVTASSAP